MRLDTDMFLHPPGVGAQIDLGKTIPQFYQGGFEGKLEGRVGFLTIPNGWSFQPMSFAKSPGSKIRSLGSPGGHEKFLLRSSAQVSALIN